MKFLGKLLNGVGHDERVGGIGVTNLRNGAFASAGDGKVRRVVPSGYKMAE